MGTVTTFGIVGTGWRARFFLRLARLVPDRLRCTGLITRTPERAAELAGDGVPVHLSVDDLLAADRPDYLIVSVPWGPSPDVIRDLVARRVPVLAETPPAPDLAGLRALWSDVGGTGLVQVAEQYLLMPGHAARRALLRQRVIGEPTSVQLSSTHLYHAVSLIRGLLDVDFEPVRVSAQEFVAPLVNPLTPAGWTGDDTPRPATTTLATLDFDGRMGLYDFTDNQWWNPLRGRRMVVRGSHGEIADDQVTRMLDASTPVTSALTRRQTGHDLNLEGLDLKHISFDGQIVYRNPFVGSGMSDDDIAVADILERAGAWARDEGPAPYPLAQACQDHAISVAMGESVRAGAPVTVAGEPWA
jgi:predicted dehydrogenase